MPWNEILQWALNLCFITALVWRYIEDKKETPSRLEERILVKFSELENLAKQCETQSQNSIARLQQETRSFEAMSDQMNRLLKQGRLSTLSFSQSWEEQELKDAMTITPEPTQIPTLHQLENTKRRLRTESPLDLKTLLKDQLA